jgi:hypothetical protein
MKLPRRTFLHLAAAAAALPALSRFAWAQAYPTRPVRLIEGFGAGSAPDIVARLIGQSLSEQLGHLAHPGGNITGFAGTDGPIGGKWLEVLKETAPNVSHVMMLMHPETPIHQAFWRSFEAAAPRFGVEVTQGAVHDAAEIERAILTFASEFLTSASATTGSLRECHFFWTMTGDHSRTLPQGGGCAAPKRCPGWVWGPAGASMASDVGSRQTLPIAGCDMKKAIATDGLKAIQTLDTSGLIFKRLFRKCC